MAQDVYAVGQTRKEELYKLKQECFACQDCTIGQNNAFDNLHPHVFARGHVFAEVFFIGQNPGKDEVIKRRPFVGQSGRILDGMILDLGLTPKQYYISNTVKCFTPKNRMPTDDEIKKCKKFLERELAIIKPKAIVTLGNPALQRMTGLTGINRYRGQALFSPDFNVEIFALMHPANLLYNEKENRPKMNEDLKLLKEYLYRKNNLTCQSPPASL